MKSSEHCSTESIDKVTAMVPSRVKRKNVECLILADVDELSLQYPSVDVGLSNGELHEYVVPRSEASKGNLSYFIVNRPEQVGIRPVVCQIADLYFTNENNEWEELSNRYITTSTETEKQVLMVTLSPLDEEKAKACVHVTNDAEIDMKLLVDQNLEYNCDYGSEGEENNPFVSFYTCDNISIGMSLSLKQEKILSNWFKERFTRLESGDKQVLSDSRTMYYGLSVIRGKKEDSKQSTNRALCLLSESQYFFMYKGLLRYGLEIIHSLEGEDKEKEEEELLIELFDRINSIETEKLPVLSPMQKKLWRFCFLDRETISKTVEVSFQERLFRLTYPLALCEDEVGDDQLSLVKLLSIFKQETMTIFDAIMQEKRVMFLGQKLNTSAVCYYVLSACLLVSPPIEGILKYRVFPYVYKNESFASVNGYIVGTSNQVFRQKLNLWDILCDLETGEVLKNNQTFNFHPPEYVNADSHFCASLLNLIDSYAINGYKAESLELNIRSHFQHYTKRIIHMAMGRSSFENEDTRQKTTKTNQHRLRAWRTTLSCQRYELMHQNNSIPEHIEQTVAQMHSSSKLSNGTILKILKDFREYLQDRDSILQFLSLFPDAQGGLYPIAILLLHADETIRSQAVSLLELIDQQSEGSICIAHTNHLLMLTFDRLRNQQ